MQNIHFRQIDNLHWIACYGSSLMYDELVALRWFEANKETAYIKAKQINDKYNLNVYVERDTSLYHLYILFSDEADEAEFIMRSSDGIEVDCSI